MENREMCCGCTAPAIQNFLNKNNILFRGVCFKSALYVASYDCYNVTYIFQKENGNCFVLEFSGGELEHIREERNAMEKYMMRISSYDYAEYYKFP